MSLKPQTIMVIENNIAIKWEDQSESYLSNKELRDKCPCANCSGESDVFGNVYRAEVAPETPKKYIVNGVKRRSSSLNTSRVDHIYQDRFEGKRNFFYTMAM